MPSRNGQRQAPDQAPAIVVEERMMRPGHGRAGGSRISVLSSGRCHGLKTSMPLGGQMAAGDLRHGHAWIASPGKRLASKNAQNQATKNITSEAMNRIMP